jgi:hypothetical protein
MPSLYLRLSQDEAKALAALAADRRRDLRQQAEWLLTRALRRVPRGPRRVTEPGSHEEKGATC